MRDSVNPYPATAVTDELYNTETAEKHENLRCENKILQSCQNEISNVDHQPESIAVLSSQCRRGKECTNEQSSLKNNKHVWPTKLFMSSRRNNDSGYVSFKNCLKGRTKTEATRNYSNGFLQTPRSEGEPLIKNKVAQQTSTSAKSTPDTPSSLDCVKSRDDSGISITFVPSELGQWMFVNMDSQRYEICEAERVAILRNNHRKKKLRCRCTII